MIPSGGCPKPTQHPVLQLSASRGYEGSVEPGTEGKAAAPSPAVLAVTHPLWAPFLLHGGPGGSVQTMGCSSQGRLCVRFQISWQALSSPSWGVLSWIQMCRGNGPSGNGPSDFTAGPEQLFMPLSILQPLCIRALLLNDVLCMWQTERSAVATTECQDLAVGNWKYLLVLGTAGSFPSNKPITRFLSFIG